MDGCRSLWEAGQGLARKSSLTYLTARFDVDTQTGRKPGLSEVATDMRTTRNTGSSRTFQRRMAYKGVLLQEEIAFLIDERRDKEVEHIFNKMGVIHHIRHDGHDICGQTNQEVLSKFNVKTFANILNCRSNLEIQRLL